MNASKYIEHCLPLLAAVLGNRYGLEVRVGGNKAMTSGKVIQIPALAPDCSEDALATTRGYIDHESAHVRFTDFLAIKNAKLDRITDWLLNAIEDWRVENKLATIYPGCQRNMCWLVKKLFVDKRTSETGVQTSVPDFLNYVLLTVRAWEVAEVESVRMRLRDKLQPTHAGTTDALDQVLNDVKAYCPDTGTAIEYARKLAEILKLAFSENLENKEDTRENKQPEPADDSVTNATSEATSSSADGNKNRNLDGISENADTFSDPNMPLPEGMSELLQNDLNQYATHAHSTGLEVATVSRKNLDSMSDNERQETLKSSVALRARLHGLLQTMLRQQTAIGRRGHLYAPKLYRTGIGSCKVFRSYTEQKGISTAVHILLDASGSMNGERITIANQACFSIAHVLSQIQGVNPAITSFSATSGANVYPVLKHGEKLVRFGKSEAHGGTPLASALWWVLQQLVCLKERRKIILLVSDGRPDSEDPYKDALDAAKALRIELYGIGIQTEHISDVLPNTSRSINRLSELAPAVFSVLGDALIKEPQ